MSLQPSLPSLHPLRAPTHRRPHTPYLRAQSLNTRRPMPAQVSFHTYRPRWRRSFAELNRAWIRRFFTLEPRDEAFLSDPEGRILAQGGEVFFALSAGRVVGTCALVPAGPDSWEIAKLAVSPRFRGHGIGRALLRLCIGAALARDARELLARTNPALEASLHLLQHLGFQERGDDPSGDFRRPTLLLAFPLGLGAGQAPCPPAAGWQ